MTIKRRDFKLTQNAANAEPQNWRQISAEVRPNSSHVAEPNRAERSAEFFGRSSAFAELRSISSTRDLHWLGLLVQHLITDIQCVLRHLVDVYRQQSIMFIQSRKSRLLPQTSHPEPDLDQPVSLPTAHKRGWSLMNAVSHVFSAGWQFTCHWSVRCIAGQREFASVVDGAWPQAPLRSVWEGVASPVRGFGYHFRETF